MFHRFGEFLGNISGWIWPNTGDRQLPPSVGVLSSRGAPLVCAVTYLLAFPRLQRRRNTCCMARPPVVIIQRASASAERSGQARAREWGNSYRHAELSGQSTKQARRAVAAAVAAGLFYGILLRASAALGHYVHAELPSPSRGRARSVPLASEGFLSPLSWRVGGVGGGDCSIQVVRLMAAPSPAQRGGGGGYGGR